MANGRRVVTDGKASTRHVVAGLAEALGGRVVLLRVGAQREKS